MWLRATRRLFRFGTSFGRLRVAAARFDPGSNIVDVYVGYLRKKLGKHRIQSLRGMGYRLEKEQKTVRTS